MSQLLIFAGTSEGRKLSAYLASFGMAHTICVATEYGEILLKPHPLVQVRRGRMDQQEIRTLLLEGRFQAVIDATHPYAEEITANLRQATSGLNIPCLRLKRADSASAGQGHAVFFETDESCAKALEQTGGNILLTVGSKRLPAYCHSETLRKRLYVRVLPSPESLSACQEQGIPPQQVIAMQGPFSTELNAAIIRQYHIACLVTKESGKAGGYPEKMEAARQTGIPAFVIGRPKEKSHSLPEERRFHAEGCSAHPEEYGAYPEICTSFTKECGSLDEICRTLEHICQKKFPQKGQIEVVLAGIGMGNPEGITKEVQSAIEVADMVCGAKRMLAQCPGKGEKHPFYQAGQILPYLQEIQETGLYLENKKAVVLFSGDSGFYSGCQPLYQALCEEIQAGRLRAAVSILPGISSVAYLAAQLGESYQDAAIYSTHGKHGTSLIRKIRHSPRIFLLTSGVEDVRKLGKELLEAGLATCEVVIGYQLSYKQQKIEAHTPRECCNLEEEGSYTCLIRNPCAMPRRLTHGMADDAFLRGQVPMTKREIREAAICMLQLHSQAVAYDVGSGTGSVAVEIASLCEEIQVYAIERRQEAATLIERNKQQFHLQNITIVKAEAPEGMEGLPAPTHAFIGGSGGRLREILSCLCQKNPTMRVVITAATLETLCEIREALPLYPTGEEETVQIQASRAKERGKYHLMQAENPVWICAFTFCS